MVKQQQPARKFRVYIKYPNEKWEFSAMFVWRADAYEYALNKYTLNVEVKIMHGKNKVNHFRHSSRN